MRKNFTPEQMLHTLRQVEGGMVGVHTGPHQQ